MGKKFIEVGSGTCQLSLSSLSAQTAIIAMDPTEASLRLGKDFAEKNNINNVVFLNSDIFDDVIRNPFLMWFGAAGCYITLKTQKKALRQYLNGPKMMG